MYALKRISYVASVKSEKKGGGKAPRSFFRAIKTGESYLHIGDHRNDYYPAGDVRVNFHKIVIIDLSLFSFPDRGERTVTSLASRVRASMTESLSFRWKSRMCDSRMQFSRRGKEFVNDR